jgi:Ca-activated chloride channel family protein
VQERPNDRIDLWSTPCLTYETPVTSDKAIVEEAIKKHQDDNVLQDGTGIGMGLATAVNRLRQ